MCSDNKYMYIIHPVTIEIKYNETFDPRTVKVKAYA
jgi:hypothetical protein